jgi:hypothetical protein
MFFELIGTLVAGVAAALLVWAVNRTLKGRLPKWVMPVAAGGAMLLATISSEYGWYARTKANMPEGLIVANAIEEKPAFYRPWTYVKPYVTRFVAVDRPTMRTHADQRIVDLVFYGRWERTAKVPVLYDCASGRRADIVDGVEFGDNGEVLNVIWLDVSSVDPVLKAACEEV